MPRKALWQDVDQGMPEEGDDLDTFQEMLEVPRCLSVSRRWWVVADVFHEIHPVAIVDSLGGNNLCKVLVRSVFFCHKESRVKTLVSVYLLQDGQV